MKSIMFNTYIEKVILYSASATSIFGRLVFSFVTHTTDTSSERQVSFVRFDKMSPLLILIGVLYIRISSVTPWITITPEDLLKRHFDTTNINAPKLKTPSRAIYDLHGHSEDNHHKTALHDALKSKSNDSKAAQRILHSSVAWHDLPRFGNHLDINEAKITRSYNNEKQNDLLKPPIYLTIYTDRNVESLNRNNPGVYMTNNDRKIYNNHMFLEHFQAPHNHHEALEAIHYAPMVRNEGEKTPRKRYKIRYNRKIRFHHKQPVNPQPTLVTEFHNHLVQDADVNIDRGNEHDLVTESLKHVNLLPSSNEMSNLINYQYAQNYNLGGVYNNQEAIIPANDDGKDQSTLDKEKFSHSDPSDMTTENQQGEKENHKDVIMPDIYHGKDLSSFDEEEESSDVTAENQVESNDNEIVKVLPDLISKKTINPELLKIEQETQETSVEETGEDKKTGTVLHGKVISGEEVKLSGENIPSVRDIPSTRELAGVENNSDGIKLSKTLCKLTEKLLSGDRKALNIWKFVKILDFLKSNIASRNGATVSKNSLKYLDGSKEPESPATRNENVNNLHFDYLNETIKNTTPSEILFWNNKSQELNTEQPYSKLFDIKRLVTSEETQNELVDKINQHLPLETSLRSLKAPEIDITDNLTTKRPSTTPSQSQNSYLPLQTSLRSLKHPDINIIDYLATNRPPTTPPPLLNLHAGIAHRHLNPHIEILNDYIYDDLEPSNGSNNADDLKHILGNLNSENPDIGKVLLMFGREINKGEDENVIKSSIERKDNLNENKGSEVSDAPEHRTKDDTAKELLNIFFATFGSPKDECFEEVQTNLTKELKHIIDDYINHQVCNSRK